MTGGDYRIRIASGSNNRQRGKKMQGKITEARPSKSGKSVGFRIGGDTNWYQTKEMEIISRVGCTATFVPEPSDWNGQTINWANDLHITDDGPLQAPVQGAVSVPAPMPAPVAVAPPTTPTVETGKFGDYAPFISNVVAHAIESKLIVQPDQIEGWVRAAFLAAERAHVATTDEVPW
tara:strand:+ start:59 stop:589 length:531 start_codon:yes stop_codon:yes gene_type:complete